MPVTIWTPDSGAAPARPLQVLAVGPHPDDAELGVGGILALGSAAGLAMGVLDLTAGEMSTNGTPEERRREAVAAAAILGLVWRGCLGLPDARLRADEAQVGALVLALRVARPRLVLVTHGGDRHPDHRAAAELVRQAAFVASLAGHQDGLEPLPMPRVAHYPINDMLEADLVVDVSEVYGLKRRALAAHASQFDPQGRKPTLLNDPAFLAMIQSRDAFYGSRAGGVHGEALVLDGPLLLADLAPLLGAGNRRGG